MEFISTEIDGLKILKRPLHDDWRGSFERAFDSKEFSLSKVSNQVAQINVSLTKDAGVVRGLHYQLPPYAETKTVTCLKGSVFDVAVDIRFGSQTFLKWYGQLLEPGSGLSLVIPPGFAHGFQTLENNSELLYIHDQFYSSKHEGGIHPTDSSIGIEWPIEINGMSERDSSLPLVNSNWEGLKLA